MKPESLKEILDKCCEVIINSKINNKDKVELLINLYNLLNEKEYEKNINILKKLGGKRNVRKR